MQHTVITENIRAALIVQPARHMSATIMIRAPPPQSYCSVLYSVAQHPMQWLLYREKEREREGARASRRWTFDYKPNFG